MTGASVNTAGSARGGGQVCLGAFTPDGGRAVIASGGDEVLCDDRLRELPGRRRQKPGGVVTCVAVGPDGTDVAVGGAAGTVRVTTIGVHEALFRGHTGPVRGAAFAPDGNCVVTAGDDGVRVWALSRDYLKSAEETLSTTFQFVGSSIRPVGGHPDDGPRRTPHDLISLTALPPMWSRSRQISLDGSLMAVEHRLRERALYDAVTGRPVSRLPIRQSVTLSPDGRLAAADAGVWIDLSDTRTGRRAGRVPAIRLGRPAQPDDLTARLLTVRRVKWPTWVAAARAFDPATQFDRLNTTDMAFNPTGTLLAAVTWDSAVWVWDVGSGARVAELPVGRPPEPPNSPRWRSGNPAAPRLSFHPDGRHVAVYVEREVRIWDLSLRRHAATLRGHTGDVEDVGFSDDGERVATASRDATARVWDARTGEPLVELRGHTEAVAAVAFAPGGERVLTAGADRIVRVWDTRTGQPVLDIPTPAGVVGSLGFDRTGTRLYGHGGESVRGVLPPAWEAPRAWDQDDEDAGRWRMTAPQAGWHTLLADAAARAPGEYRFVGAVHLRQLARLAAARGDAAAADGYSARAEALLAERRKAPASAAPPPTIPPAKP